MSTPFLKKNIPLMVFLMLTWKTHYYRMYLYKEDTYVGLERITYFRKKQNMSIEELSIKSGVPIGTLSKISAGITKEPRLDTVKAIAKALNCLTMSN